MDRGQVFTYALVNTLWIPCVATIAVLARELGWRRATAISALTVGLALAVGGMARAIIAAF
jgi:ferrous iron transport protein B